MLNRQNKYTISASAHCPADQQFLWPINYPNMYQIAFARLFAEEKHYHMLCVSNSTCMFITIDMSRDQKLNESCQKNISVACDICFDFLWDIIFAQDW